MFTLKFLRPNVKNLINTSIKPQNIIQPKYSKSLLRSTQKTTTRSYASVSSTESYYDILKIPHHADKARIKASFYKLSKIHHPDLNPDNEEAHNQFLKLNEAYSVLSDADRKKDYDRNFLGKVRSGSMEFSNRFRNRSATKPVKQYPQNVKFKSGHNFTNTSNEYNDKEYTDNHYPELRTNTPFRFNSRSHVNDEPNIESSSAVWGRMMAVFIMMTGCYVTLDLFTGKHRDDNKR